MGILVALTIGLVWWIVAWSFGIKAFDAFLLTVALVLVAFTIQLVKPYVDRMLGRADAAPDQPGSYF